MRLRRKPKQPAEAAPSEEARAAEVPQTPTPAAPAPAPTPAEHLDGLRAWVAQLDRKIGVRTYAGGAAIVLALAAGIVGVVLATSAKDESATKEEVSALQGQLETVGQEATEAAEDDVATLSQRLDELESRVDTIASGQRTSDSELSVVKDDIEDLRTQISTLRSEGGGDGGN